jgi:hypothetical protein
VLRETTSRGLCGLVCPSRTSNHQREGEGYCVKGGWGGEGERKRERALGLLLCHGPVCVLPLPTLDNMKHSLFRKDRTVLGTQGVCSDYFQPNPSRPAEHVTAPANCNYWICWQSLRPSLAPNHPWSPTTHLLLH